MSTTQLPQIDSIQELAAFWDTHDLTDFEDQLEVVTAPVFEHGTVIALHLPAVEAEAVHEQAQSKGLSDEELIRGWVRERIDAA